MLTTISIILISVCLIIIIVIVVKKFPAMAILDVSNMPGERETKFKDEIIKARISRDISRVSGPIANFLLFSSKRISSFLDFYHNYFKKIKLTYKTNVKIPWPEKQKKIQELLLAAEDYLKKELLEKAEEKLVEIISLDSKNLNAFSKLAALYEDLKKFPEARQTYHYALKLARQHQHEKEIMGELSLQEIYFDLAWLEKEAGDLKTSLDNVREALDLEPNNPRYLDLILDLSIIMKDKEQAQEYLLKLAEVNPENQKLAEIQREIDLL